MTGYEPDSYRARYPDMTPEEMAKYELEASDSPRRCPYEVADRMALQDGAEWRILTVLCCIDSYGYCEMEAWRNPEGGYEDDVFLTRSDNQLEEGPPTFVFKPSGYSMAWYKYYWRSPEQSENLSIGEIRRIFRLCIENIIYKREIPKGTTRELLGLPIHTVEVPDDIRDRVDRVCRMAECSTMGTNSTSFGGIFAYCPDIDGLEKRAAGVIKAIEGPEWTSEWLKRHDVDRKDARQGARQEPRAVRCGVRTIDAMPMNRRRTSTTATSCGATSSSNRFPTSHRFYRDVYRSVLIDL